MFEVGDKVRYVPNEDSTRAYRFRENHVGEVAHVMKSHVKYPYSVTFSNYRGEFVFSEAELVKVA